MRILQFHFCLLSVLFSIGLSHSQASSPNQSIGQPASSKAQVGPLEQAELVRLACPGHITKDRQGAFHCSSCPKNSIVGSGTADIGWTFDGIILGHFTGGATEEAIMRTFGCEDHVHGFVDDFLFRKVNSRWMKIRFIPLGSVGPNCQKVGWGNNRDALICRSGDMHQGHGVNWIQLFIVQPFQPRNTEPQMRGDSIFMSISDDDTDCDAGVDSVIEHNQDRYAMQNLEIVASFGRDKTSKAAPGTCLNLPRRTIHLFFLGKEDHFEAAAQNPKLDDEGIKNCCDVSVATIIRPQEL